MAAVLEEARRHSHRILAAHGQELPRLLQEKELWATIDKGHARALLASENLVSPSTFGVVSAYFAVQGAPWVLCALSLALVLVSLCSVLRYSYPLGVVRRALVEQPQMAPALIDAGVVTLNRASELPEVRNRAF
jgi:hypothetical protein